MPSAGPCWTFGPFALDLANACLWRGADAVALSPKAFDVLHYLVTHPDRLVTKDELLDAVWPETAVSDAVVRVAIGALRKALDDTRPPPRFIATVPRRGYRFLAPVTLAPSSAPTAAAPAPPAALPLAPPPLLVEREAVLHQLHTRLAQAQQGTRQVVWVTGEPGMGKTAVVETFVVQAMTQAPLWVVHGQCVEHYSTGEAYQPVLEALGHLCRAPEGERLVALLRQRAPTWLVQMPWLLDAADRERLQQELHGATRERMLRECAEVVDALTAETPLLLILEDLHWSDDATLDLLALLARRRTPARLFVLGTYRPGEVSGPGHPLGTITHALQQQGYGTELALEGLSAAAVAAYLAARCPGQRFPETLVRWLHQRTEGHPFFLVNLVEALIAQGDLVQREGRWVLQTEIEAIDMRVPESIEQMIEQQLARLSPEAQRIVEVASVAGIEFSAAAVAAGLVEGVVAVEELCEGLVRRQHWLRPAGVAAWPDGTVATRYRFTHWLYQHVAYQRLGAARRVQLHQRLGARGEVGYGDRVGEIAAELAMHFEHGRDYRRAVQYLQQEAETALRRYAYPEAITCLTKGLELLSTLAESPERSQHELEVQLTLGPVLMATQGRGAPEVERLYTRARALCELVGEGPDGPAPTQSRQGPDGPAPTQSRQPLQLFRVLWGLQGVYGARGDYQQERAVGEELLSLAQRLQNPALLLEAHHALWSTLFFGGELVAARAHQAQGLRLYEPQRHRAHAALYSGHDPGVCCRLHAGLCLWLLGYPDQAVASMQAALALAQQLAHPYSLNFALHWAAMLHQLRREVSLVQARAEAAMAIATDQEFLELLARTAPLRGWALAACGHAEEGRAQLRQGLATRQAMGMTGLRAYYLTLLAEVCAQMGHTTEGLEALAEALTTLTASRHRWWEAELYRLRGELLLRCSVAQPGEAETCFQQALAVARRQQAKSLELRAAMSLSRLWQHQGQRAAAYDLLTPVYDWFTEGFDTADLQEAKALLETLRE